MKIKNIPPTYLFTAIAIVPILWLIIPEINFIIYPYNLVGMLPLLLGFILMRSVRNLLRANNTTHSFDESTFIVQESLFSWSRNPMYLGMVLLLTGWAVLFQNAAGLITPVIFFMVIQFKFIPFEEAKMYNTFGEEYLSYKRTVRKWF